jgi:hypothetical protein
MFDWMEPILKGLAHYVELHFVAEIGGVYVEPKCSTRKFIFYRNCKINISTKIVIIYNV